MPLCPRGAVSSAASGSRWSLTILSYRTAWDPTPRFPARAVRNAPSAAAHRCCARGKIRYSDPPPYQRVLRKILRWYFVCLLPKETFM